MAPEAHEQREAKRVPLVRGRESRLAGAAELWRATTFGRTASRQGTVCDPMSLTVRDATTADYGVFARLFPALGVPDPLLTTAQFEERMLPNMLIAEEVSDAVAYAHWRVYGRTAHVVHVVVDARARGCGVGRSLMDAMRMRIVAAHATRWYLNVKADNKAAIRLYERVGLAVEQRGWSMSASWSDLLAIAGDTEGRPGDITVDQANQLAVERGIDPERLALVRSRPGTVFVGLRNENGPCALAVFDPAFPGIYPIVVRQPDHARGLFEALFAHARAPHVHLFVEGDAALADSLRAGGVALDFEILRMGAALG
jgi:GNAT superfamily N-acetyltransferase